MKLNIKNFHMLSISMLFTAISQSALAYPPADNTGYIYPELQNLQKIANTLNLNPKTILGYTLINNYKENLLAPWQQTTIEQTIKNFDYDIKSNVINMIKQALPLDKKDMYYLSGAAVTNEWVENLINIVQHSDIRNTYNEMARAIITKDSSASFFPSNQIITNNLAKSSNSGTDQKNASSPLTHGTPVYVFAQLITHPELNNAYNSWLLIWRPEFGLKFVRSDHVSLISKTNIAALENANNTLHVSTTDRLMSNDLLTRLSKLSPLFLQKNNTDQNFYIADQHPLITSRNQLDNPLDMHNAYLVSTNLFPLESNKRLRNQISQVDIRHKTISVGDYIENIHNAMFTYPSYVINNENIPFAWGDGIAGTNNLKGQDASLFLSNIYTPTGIALPRYSKEQIDIGMKMNPIYEGHSSNHNEYYNQMVKHCSLGRIASYHSGNLMVCLGSVTVSQLNQISTLAYQDAIKNGMDESDYVPLVAASAIGFKTDDAWYITGNTAVFPLLKNHWTGSWLQKKSLKIFSYLRDKLIFCKIKVSTTPTISFHDESSCNKANKDQSESKIETVTSTEKTTNTEIQPDLTLYNDTKEKADSIDQSTVNSTEEKIHTEIQPDLTLYNDTKEKADSIDQSTASPIEEKTNIEIQPDLTLYNDTKEKADSIDQSTASPIEEKTNIEIQPDLTLYNDTKEKADSIDQSTASPIEEKTNIEIQPDLTLYNDTKEKTGKINKSTVNPTDEKTNAEIQPDLTLYNDTKEKTGKINKSTVNPTEEKTNAEIQPDLTLYNDTKEKTGTINKSTVNPTEEIASLEKHTEL